MALSLVRVVLDVPLKGAFDYRLPMGMSACRGQRVVVPFGKSKRLVGLVVSLPSVSEVEPDSLKEVIRVIDDLPPFGESWMQMAEFAAQYYRRGQGEVFLSVLPPSLRKGELYSDPQLPGPVKRIEQRQQQQRERALKKAAALVRQRERLLERERKAAAKSAGSLGLSGTQTSSDSPSESISPLESEPARPNSVGLNSAMGSESVAQSLTELTVSPAFAHYSADALDLNDEQSQVLEQISQQQNFKTMLLYGVTGSGKTEVYLQATERVLAAGKQVLFLVPEINLTPQFAQALQVRFVPRYSAQAVAVLHSRLNDTERVKAWVNIQQQRSQIVLGTRMAVFAPLENLGLIIVDEEHDPSYKQQENLRYSARDLAIWRAKQLDIPIVLGSATPSLESWYHASTGRYHKLVMRHRAKAVELPAIQLVNTKNQYLNEGLSKELIQAIEQRLQRGEQSLVYLNRRGYSPILRCKACDWTSECPNCSVHSVMHKSARGFSLQCHHCGFQQAIPRICPNCGNQDLSPLGQGTQKLEEALGRLFPEARLLRIDADSTRHKGSAAQLFEQVHEGEVDIMIGTQMVAKGHDYKRLGLVGILNADFGIYSNSFRSAERMFASLMQVAGRAGRHIQGAEVLLQTDYPEHIAYQSLVQHDYDSFAEHLLSEREVANLPPFSHQILLSAQASQLEFALDFLRQAVQLGREQLAPLAEAISIYDPIPLHIVRVNKVERAQVLFEASSRPVLHRFIQQLQLLIEQQLSRSRVRYTIEVDPLEI